LTRHIHLSGSLQENGRQCCIRFYSTIEIIFIYRQKTRIMDCINADNICRNIPILVLMRGSPCFCTTQASLFRTCENHTDFSVFKIDSMLFHLPQQGNPHITAGKVIVCAVDNFFRVKRKPDCNEKRKKEKAPTGGGQRPCPRAANSTSRNHSIESNANQRHYIRYFKHNAAEMIVQCKFPRRIDMTIEKNTTFYFALTGTNCRHIYTLAFRKHPVNDRFIHHKVENEQKYGYTSGNQADDGMQKKTEAGYGIKHRRHTAVSVKRIRMCFKCLNNRLFTSALIVKNLCHVFRCFALSSAAGRPLFHVPADVCDFGRYILYSIFAVRLKIRNFHMIVCIFIVYASNHGWPTSANHLSLRKLPDSWASSARQTESCHTKITLK